MVRIYCGGDKCFTISMCSMTSLIISFPCQQTRYVVLDNFKLKFMKLNYSILLHLKTIIKFIWPSGVQKKVYNCDEFTIKIWTIKPLSNFILLVTSTNLPHISISWNE